MIFHPFQQYQDNVRVIMEGCVQSFTAMKPCLWLERFPPLAGLEPRGLIDQ